MGAGVQQLADANSGTAKESHFEVFFDGDCPLCVREINMLRRLDRDGRIRFTDIAAPDFSARVLGVTQNTLMGEIHGRYADGTWVQGVDVFRALYGAVGFRRLVAISRLPGISHLLGVLYRVFARNRLWLTGRRGAHTDCTDGTCRRP